MKTTIKHENDEFFVITLKHVSGITVVVNHPRTPKLWVIGNENVLKARKLRVFVTLKHASGNTIDGNRSETQNHGQ